MHARVLVADPRLGALVPHLAALGVAAETCRPSDMARELRSGEFDAVVVDLCSDGEALLDAVDALQGSAMVAVTDYPELAPLIRMLGAYVPLVLPRGTHPRLIAGTVLRVVERERAVA